VFGGIGAVHGPPVQVQESGRSVEGRVGAGDGSPQLHGGVEVFVVESTEIERGSRGRVLIGEEIVGIHESSSAGVTRI
jgi:hypothetical protein